MKRLNLNTNTKVDMLMNQVCRQLIKTKKLILEQFELTYSQFEVLAAIHYYTLQNKKIIQANLSEKTNIDPMTISIILRNLEKKGLISRKRNSTDTRVINVQFTPLGEDLFHKAVFEITSSSDSIYENVNTTHLTNELTTLYNKLNNLKY